MEIEATVFESNYDRAHREALLRKEPFDTCLDCHYFDHGCTIGFKLKRKGESYVCKDFISKEEVFQRHLESKAW